MYPATSIEIKKTRDAEKFVIINHNFAVEKLMRDTTGNIFSTENEWPILLKQWARKTIKRVPELNNGQCKNGKRWLITTMQ